MHRPVPLSVVIPKSEVLRKTGALLIARGYEVRVLDLTSPAASFCYNPLRYIQSDKDALRMIDTLIQATTPPDSKKQRPVLGQKVKRLCCRLWCCTSSMKRPKKNKNNFRW